MTHRPDRLEPLTSTPNEPQAAMIVSVLRERGIKAVAEGGLTAGFRAETIGEVRIMVWQEDLERARLALAEFQAQMQDFDWDGVDVGELE
jgi:Putative prokaryotic signal transducing protein